jgi:hypothetical protein
MNSCFIPTEEQVKEAVVKLMYMVKRFPNMPTNEIKIVNNYADRIRTLDSVLCLADVLYVESTILELKNELQKRFYEEVCVID